MGDVAALLFCFSLLIAQPAFRHFIGGKRRTGGLPTVDCRAVGADAARCGSPDVAVASPALPCLLVFPDARPGYCGRQLDWRRFYDILYIILVYFLFWRSARHDATRG